MGNILLKIDTNKRLNTINPLLYSSFAEHLGRCIYSGLWVGEKSGIKNEAGLRVDSLAALKELEIPVLRWPGGCFADNYHWLDGVGPRCSRPKRSNIWWKQPESNAFGTDEFMRLCSLIGSEPYLAINVGSGTVQEAQNWIEYCNSNQNTEYANLRMRNGNIKPYNVKYWGIGNENWGCGGSMRPEYYADLYRQYATYIRQQTDNNVKLIACGSNTDFEDWDQSVLANIDSHYFNIVDYISLHVYTGWGISQETIDDNKYYEIIAGIDITKRKLEKTISLCKDFGKRGKEIKVILDEWGIWYKEADIPTGLNQHGLMLDAIFTGLNFHMFHQMSGDLIMTNLAQTANVLQSFIETRGPELILTPTYYVYCMYKPHRNKILLPVEFDSPKAIFADGSLRDSLSVSCSISVNADELFITIINIDLSNNYNLTLPGFIMENYSVKEALTLNAQDIASKNTFKDPSNVKPRHYEQSDTKDFVIEKHSVNSILLNKR